MYCVDKKLYGNLIGIDIDSKDLCVDVKYNNQILFGPTFIITPTNEICATVYKNVCLYFHR